MIICGCSKASSHIMPVEDFSVCLNLYNYYVHQFTEKFYFNLVSNTLTISVSRATLNLGIFLKD